MGLIIGLFAAKYAIREGGFGTTKVIVFFNVIQVVSNAVAWILVAPVLDIAIYAEPVNKVFVQGIFAFIGNIIIIGILGTLLCVGLFSHWSQVFQSYQRGLIHGAYYRV